jgi:hypothetical protein
MDIMRVQDDDDSSISTTGFDVENLDLNDVEIGEEEQVHVKLACVLEEDAYPTGCVDGKAKKSKAKEVLPKWRRPLARKSRRVAPSALRIDPAKALPKPAQRNEHRH